MAISALVVAVPEAQALVGDLRARFDDTTALGVPPHVTILAPFMAPQTINHEVVSLLQEAASTIRAFRFSLTQVHRWPEAAWLAPEPHDRFVELTRNIAALFPDFPPYAGRHDNIIPHLTVAHGSPESAALAEAELKLRMRTTGRVEGFCERVTLLENASGMWKKMLDLPLERP